MSYRFIDVSASLLAVTSVGVFVTTLDAQSRRYFPLPTPGNALTTADIDNDGDTDVLVEGDEVMVFTNLGGGEFVETQRLEGTNLIVGDVDQDHDLDILTIGAAGTLTHLNGGAGVFLPPVETADVTGLSLGDINGDGRPDLIGIATWAQYDGVGGWLPSGIVPIGDLIYGVTHVVAGDIDGDGDTDVAMLGYTDVYSYVSCDAAGAHVAINEDGVGTSWSDCVPWVGGIEHYPRDLTIGDLDNEGDLEVSTVFRYDPLFPNNRGERSHISDCDGPTAKLWRDPSDKLDNNPSDFVRLADIDGDGRLDGIGGQNTRYWGGFGRIKVYRNLGNLRFRPGGLAQIGPVGVSDFQIADVSGDGLQDALVLTPTEIIVILQGTELRVRPTLASTPAIRGQSTDFTITGAAPNAQVGFAYTYDGPGISRGIQALGWSALDLNGSVSVAGFTTADTNGNATFSFAVPPDAPLRTLTVQAVATPGGGINNTIKSNFVSVRVEE